MVHRGGHGAGSAVAACGALRIRGAGGGNARCARFSKSGAPVMESHRHPGPAEMSGNVQSAKFAGVWDGGVRATGVAPGVAASSTAAPLTPSDSS